MSKKTFKYSQALDELNRILQDLQSENVDVDEVSAKVKRAMELIRVCKDKIQATEMEVKKIVKEFEQEFEQEE